MLWENLEYFSISIYYKQHSLGAGNKKFVAPYPHPKNMYYNNKWSRVSQDLTFILLLKGLLHADCWSRISMKNYFVLASNPIWFLRVLQISAHRLVQWDLYLPLPLFCCISVKLWSWPQSQHIDVLLVVCPPLSDGLSLWFAVSFISRAVQYIYRSLQYAITCIC